MTGVAGDDLGEIFREEFGRVVATLVRVLGDIDSAEDAAQEAFAVAAEKWPVTGVPPNPGGWVVTTAKRRAIDRLRREARRPALETESTRWILPPDDEPEEVGAVRDDQLRLIFTCCHPALGRPAQVALALRLLGGLHTGEIARAFLVAEDTMAQRLVRAKRKIKAARIPYRVPQDADLPARLRSVLDVLYLVFNEGHTASAGPELGRPDLTAEAIRLTRRLRDLMPDEPEVTGLLAFELLTESRRPARTRPDGSLVRLSDQDRSLWDGELIREGQDLVRAGLRRNQPGLYQIQAAIAAVHSDAATAEATDWGQVVALYDQLVAIAATPVVALNRAVAVAELVGPQQGLDALAGLDLGSYHLWHATRAELLTRLGRTDEAVHSLRSAIELTTNEVERRHLRARLDAMPGDG